MEMQKLIYTYKKISSTTASIFWDSELFLYYVKDNQLLNDPSVLKECNLKFIKILINCEVLQLKQGKILPLIKSINIDHINYIVDYIEELYKENHFTDSDLEDAIFDHFNIVSPKKIDDSYLKNQFLTEHSHRFSLSEKTGKPLKIDTFLKNRSQIFCFYIFLRRCAILYRDTDYKEPLNLLLNFLDPQLNSQALNNLNIIKGLYLRVKSLKYFGDNWTTGLHEWLTCEKTVNALKRTARIGDNVEAFIKPVEGLMTFPDGNTQYFVFTEFNWIDFQFLIRTPTNFLLYAYKLIEWPNEGLEGHPGSMSEEINRWTGGRTPADIQFHNYINGLFDGANSIGQFMSSIANLYKQNCLLHDGVDILPYMPSLLRARHKILSDGTNTHNYDGIRFFQQKLKKPRIEINMWLRDILEQTDLNTLSEGDTVIYSFEEDNLVLASRTVIKGDKIGCQRTKPHSSSL